MVHDCLSVPFQADLAARDVESEYLAAALPCWSRRSAPVVLSGAAKGHRTMTLTWSMTPLLRYTNSDQPIIAAAPRPLVLQNSGYATG